MPYEIQKVLVVSTSHISREKADELVKMGLKIEQNEFCFMLYVSPDDDEEDFISDHGADIGSLMTIAQQQDCTYIKFDRDGPVLDNYPVYDW